MFQITILKTGDTIKSMNVRFLLNKTGNSRFLFNKLYFNHKLYNAQARFAIITVNFLCNNLQNVDAFLSVSSTL